MLISQKLDAATTQTESQTQHSSILWHSNRDLLAVSSFSPVSGGYVSFVSKKGGKSFYSNSARSDQHVNSVEWHPTETILAIGWESGAVSLVDPLNSKERDVLGGQLDDVRVVSWSCQGQTLLAGDSRGNYAIFTMQRNEIEKMKFERAFQIENEIPICSCSKKLNKIVRSKPPSGKGPRPQTSKNDDDELAKILAQSRLQQKEMDNGGPDDGLEFTGLQKDIDGVVSFIIATSNSALYVVRPDEEPRQIYTSDSPMKQVLKMSGQYVVAISENLMFYQLVIEGNSVDDKIKVKLSGKPECFQVIQIDSNIVAICYGEREIRIWDLQKEDSAVFRLTQERGYNGNEQICLLSHSTKKDSISGATLDGKIATWKRHRESYDLPIDQQWRLQSSISIGGKMTAMAWSNTSPTLAVCSTDSIQIFRSQSVATCVDTRYAMVQLGPQQVSLIKIVEPIESQDIRFEHVISGFHLHGRHFVTWNEEQLYVHEIIDHEDSPLDVQQLSVVSAPSVSNALIYGQQLYSVEKGQLNVRTFQGTLKKTISFREIEGDVDAIDLNGRWLVLGSTHGYLRVYELNDGNIRQAFQSSQLTAIRGFERFSIIRVNCHGVRVSLKVLKRNDEVDERLYIWDAESDTLSFFSFADGLTDQQQYEAQLEKQRTVTAAGRLKTAGGLRSLTTPPERPKTAAARRIERDQNRFRLPFHLPGEHRWDTTDGRFVCCEANHVNADGSADFLLTMFATADNGLQIHDLQPKPVKADRFVWLSVPFVYFYKNVEVDEADDVTVERSISRLLLRRTLREFVGIAADDRQAVEAMIDFAFFLCIEQMDKAFTAIKFIKNEQVWESMARMCVKTRRVDVALVCLGHMRNARAASAVRESIRKNESLEMQTACLAIQLDMIDEAEAIYKQSKRYDLLNRLYQSQNKWTEAFEIASKHDRIHLRNTHYNFAKYLESIREVEQAIENYEKSQTHHFEVPRMLADEPKAVDLYVKRKRDRELYRWWARYLESVGDLDGARNYYKYADDFLAVIRILCYDGRIEEATEVVNRSDDRAAAFHLARYFEANSDFEQAVHFFTKASSYNTAIRLAREHEMSDKLASLALLAGGNELIETARYYEDLPGYADKAVLLYHKAGMIGRALDLAFRTEQFSALDLIARDLNEDSDPQVLQRAAQFFSSNQRDRTAVLLLAYAKKFSEAVELCHEKSVLITEEIAELLTPPRTAPDRKALLEEIARCCLQQANYYFAAKKFTQAGNKTEAMKALLRSGDTPKIILFANTAKSKDIYKMAGNYLQSLNWRDDATLMRQIESFYMKAGAFDSLAMFYEACAELEIDDYHDYEKAITAYNEAIRCWNKKSEKDGDLDNKVSNKRDRVKSTVNRIKEFIGIKELYNSDPGAAMTQMNAMANDQKDGVIRLGDIYAFLINHNAYQFIQEYQSKKPTVDISEYISEPIIDQICDEANMPRITRTQLKEQNSYDEEDVVEFSHALKRRMSQYSDDDSNQMVGIAETMNEPMEVEKPTVESKNETIIVVQHNWHEVTNSENDETFFISYRRPGEKSTFFDVKLNKKDKTFQSADVECEKLPYRALKVRFPKLDGLSKTFISPFAEYDQIHKGPVNSIDTNKSGNLVVTSDLNSSTLTVWNSSSGEVLREMADHVLDVNCARFFPSGLVILSAGMDMSIRIWSVERGQSVRVLKGHTAPILDIEFIGNGAEVLSSAKDKTIKRWNCGSSECVTTIQVPRGNVNSLRLNEDESLLLGGSDENCLFIWDTQTKQLIAEVNVHEPCTSITTRDHVVYVGGSNGTISVVDLRQKSLIRTIKVNRGRVHKVLAVKSGVLASFADGGVCFYSTSNLTLQSQFEWTGADCDPIYDFAISGKYLFTACRDKVIRKYVVDSFLPI